MLESHHGSKGLNNFHQISENKHKPGPLGVHNSWVWVQQNSFGEKFDRFCVISCNNFATFKKNFKF